MRELLKIAASSDIHSPKNLDLFKASVHRLKEADLLILAGDVIYKGRAPEIKKVLEIVESVFKGPIVACFGNEEFDEVKENLKDLTQGSVTWLDDEALELEIKGYRVGLVGTRGSLDQPTSWQLKNLRSIGNVYERRVEAVSKLLAELKTEFKIIFSHYALLYDTLKGENPKIWPQLGSLKMAEVLKLRKPSVAIHGHTHNSKVASVNVYGTLVLNVSLPSLREIVLFNLPLGRERQIALTSFL